MDLVPTGMRRLFLLPLLISAILRGQEPAPMLEELVVEAGGTERKIDKTQLSPAATASPGAVTQVGQEEISLLSVESYGDLFRSVAGVTVNNFGQGAVAYGISLRGFPSGSHGKDVAFFLDGIPLNESGGSPTGYADLNILVPELIESFDVIRGPLSVRSGNYALGGTIDIRTFDQPRSRVAVSGGSYESGRLLGSYGFSPGSVDLSFTGVGEATEGYRENTEIYSANVLGSAAFKMLNGTGVVRLQAYQNDFGAPGYLNRDLLEAGVIGRRAAIDETDGGSKDYVSLGFTYRDGDPDGGDRTLGTFYALHNESTRWANFATTPGLGTQGQRDVTTGTVGGRLEKYFVKDRFGILAGMEHRSDFSELDRFSTIRRRIQVRTRDVNADQHNSAAYLQADYKPTEWAKLTLGGRYDHFFVDGENALVAGGDFDVDYGEFSPTAGASFDIGGGATIFVNYAEGLRAPSIIEELPVNADLTIADQRSYEIGGSFESDKWEALLSVYHSELEGEIQAAPAGFGIQNLGESRRIGADLQARYQAYDDGQVAVALLGTASYVDTELLTGAGGNVPNVPEYQVGAGVETQYRPGGGESVIAFRTDCTFVGPSDLTTSGTITTGTFSRITAKLSYRNDSWNGMEAYVSAIGYPGSRLDESAFAFGGAAAVSPQAPVSFRTGLSFQF